MEMGGLLVCCIIANTSDLSRGGKCDGPQPTVEFSEAGRGGAETKDLYEMRLSSTRVSEKAEEHFVDSPAGCGRFPPVLNNPIRDGLGRIIGRNFVSNIRF